jgi:hypothetical protein
MERVMKTWFARGITEVTHFETNRAGGVVAGVKTAVGASGATFERFDLNAAGCERLRTRTSVEGARTRFELFDVHADGTSPFMRVVSERLGDGGPSVVEVAVNPSDLDVMFRIGSLKYRLDSGQLREETSQGSNEHCDVQRRTFKLDESSHGR